VHQNSFKSKNEYFPLMIACTAHVDDFIRKEAKDKGFDEIFESPL
jgi:hypothetical protein